MRSIASSVRELRPESARSSHAFVGVFFMVAALVQAVRAVAQHQPAVVIGLLWAASVLSGAMAELSRRGRTRLGFPCWSSA
ncbi:hypothetical protein SSPO_095300 [Streptomyces antimycoticus]|uniref:Uncharacterized protein n=1 Tax=Streptomyces antimycoticus TaxID=68175 RepID=A0A499V010_9ACTN|nr:hypothetical protein SSPO_095300 [Streptomyces antimycoticus]